MTQQPQTRGFHKRKCAYCGSTRLKYPEELIICKKCGHQELRVKPNVTPLSL